MPATRVGVNLGGLCLSGDYSVGEFADLMRTSGFFSGFGSNPSPGYDSEWWPLRVNNNVGTAGYTGTTQVPVALNGGLPAGTYTCTAQGSGTFVFTGPGVNKTIDFDGSGTPQTFTIDAPIGGSSGFVVFVRLTRSDQNNHLRDLQIKLPGHANRVFNDAFLERLKPFAYVRLMDWLNTNNPTLVNWTDAGRVGHGFPFSIRGRVPEEYGIILANEMKQYKQKDIDVWYCQPATAVNSYRQGLHDIIENGGSIDGISFGPLNPGSVAKDEYSNEVWNPGFGSWTIHQADYAKPATQALIAAWQLKHPGNGIGGTEYIAHRNARDTRHFKGLFTNPARVEIQFMSQGGYPALGRVAERHYRLPNLFDPDLNNPLPVAVYDRCGGGFYQQSSKGPFQNTDVAGMAALFATNPEAGVAAYYAGCQQSRDDYLPLLAQYKDMGSAQGKPFGVYESGWDLNSFTTQDSNIRAFVLAVHRDPRRYDQQRLILQQVADGEYCFYWFAGTYGAFGWGAMESISQPLSSAHAYRALLDHINGLPIPDPTPPPTPGRTAMRHSRILSKRTNP